MEIKRIHTAQILYVLQNCSFGKIVKHKRYKKVNDNDRISKSIKAEVPLVYG